MWRMISFQASLAVSLLAALGAAGCGGEATPTSGSDPSTVQTGDQAVGAASADTPADAAKSKVEPTAHEQPSETSGFSTPKAAIESFIAASIARDLDALSGCFADNAPGEFDSLRQKTATSDELDELAKMMQGAKVTDVRVNESAETAVVDVKLSRRDERISMRKTDAGWKIVDF